MKWINNNPIKSIIGLGILCVLSFVFTVTAWADDDFTQDDNINIIAEGRVLVDDSDIVTGSEEDLIKNHEVDVSKEPLVYEDENGGRGFIYWEATKDKFSDTIEAIKAFVDENSSNKVSDLGTEDDGVVEPVGNGQPVAVTPEETNG